MLILPIPLVSSEIVVFHLPKGACSKDSAKSKRKSHLADQPLTSPRYPPRDPKQLLHLWSKKWTYYSSTGTRKSWAAWNKFLETVVPSCTSMDFNIDPSKVIKYVFFKDLSTRIAGFFLRPWSVSGGYICSSGWASFQACKITRQETLPIQAATRSKDYEPLVSLKSAASKWLRESIHFLAGFGVCENIRPGRPKAVGQEVAGVTCNDQGRTYPRIQIQMTKGYIIVRHTVLIWKISSSDLFFVPAIANLGQIKECNAYLCGVHQRFHDQHRLHPFAFHDDWIYHIIKYE